MTYRRRGNWSAAAVPTVPDGSGRVRRRPGVGGGGEEGGGGVGGGGEVGGGGGGTPAASPSPARALLLSLIGLHFLFIVCCASFWTIDHTSSSQLLGIAFMTYTHSNNICPGCASACNGQHKTVNIMGSHLDLMGQIGSKKGPLVLGLGIRLATLVRSEVNLSL